MSDETRTESEPNDAPEDTQKETSGEVDLSKLDSVDKLPKWAQDELKRARQEAASYRTRLNKASEEVRGEIENEFKEKVSGLQEELENLKTENAKHVAHTMRIDAALEVGVPGGQLKDFAERLRGDSYEELKADAEKAKSIFGLESGKATDPTAGLGGNGPKKQPTDLFGDYVKSQLGWK